MLQEFIMAHMRPMRLNSYAGDDGDLIISDVMAFLIDGDDRWRRSIYELLIC